MVSKASEQGDTKAKNSLGVAYDHGDGILQDSLLALMWFYIGSANGSELGGQNRAKIASRMTSEKIVEAQVIARECMSSDYQNCGS